MFTGSINFTSVIVTSSESERRIIIDGSKSSTLDVHGLSPLIRFDFSLILDDVSILSFVRLTCPFIKSTLGQGVVCRAFPSDFDYNDCDYHSMSVG